MRRGCRWAEGRRREGGSKGTIQGGQAQALRVHLEEVVRCSACDVRIALPRRRVKLEESVLQVLVDLHDGGLVAAAVAVIGGTENGDRVLFMAPVVSLHH